MNKLLLARILLKMLSLLPKKYPIVSGEEINPPFFILNAGRSGGTLLNRLLNQHSQIFLPPEQYFIHNLIIKFRLYNWILWRDLGKILAGELISSLKTHEWELDEKPLYGEIVHAKGDDRALHNVIDKIVRTYASQRNENPDIWGDSTALNIRYSQELYTCFPKAKFIFLIRDGRDVVASYKKAGDIQFSKKQNPNTACAQNWIDVYHQRKWISKETNILTIRYEELVSNPKSILSQVHSFLGLEHEELNIEQIGVPDINLYKKEHHANLKSAVNTNSIGKWKNELTEKEIDEIMPIIETPMKAFGYL